jgi:PPK2 family polyphosphate:nucleotide phosphotransferase
VRSDAKIASAQLRSYHRAFAFSLSPSSRLMPNPLKRYRIVDDDKLDLAAFDPATKVFAIGDAKANEVALKSMQKEIATLQNRLFAEAKHSLLVVLQGMDTSGKDGVAIAAFDAVHPQGLHVTAYKAPSLDEAAHDFLWRVHPHVPAKGMIALFNRSHYEAVIAERVLGLASPRECKRRYAQIVDFERMLAEHDTCIVKCFLHISPAEQKVRLQSRLTDPAKHWKFNPNDLVERKRWGANMAAYTDAIRSTSTRAAPWWIVPSDSKDDRNLMVATLVRNALAKLDPQYPPLPDAFRSITVD